MASAHATLSDEVVKNDVPPALTLHAQPDGQFRLRLCCGGEPAQQLRTPAPHRILVALDTSQSMAAVVPCDPDLEATTRTTDFNAPMGAAANMCNQLWSAKLAAVVPCDLDLEATTRMTRMTYFNAQMGAAANMCDQLWSAKLPKDAIKFVLYADQVRDVADAHSSIPLHTLKAGGHTAFTAPLKWLTQEVNAAPAGTRFTVYFLAANDCMTHRLEEVEALHQAIRAKHAKGTLTPVYVNVRERSEWRMTTLGDEQVLLPVSRPLPHVHMQDRLASLCLGVERAEVWHAADLHDNLQHVVTVLAQSIAADVSAFPQAGTARAFTDGQTLVALFPNALSAADATALLAGPQAVCVRADGAGGGSTPFVVEAAVERGADVPWDDGTCDLDVMADCERFTASVASMLHGQLSTEMNANVWRQLDQEMERMLFLDGKLRAYFAAVRRCLTDTCANGTLGTALQRLAHMAAWNATVSVIKLDVAL